MDDPIHKNEKDASTPCIEKSENVALSSIRAPVTRDPRTQNVQKLSQKAESGPNRRTPTKEYKSWVERKEISRKGIGRPSPPPKTAYRSLNAQKKGYPAVEGEVLGGNLARHVQVRAKGGKSPV